MPKSSKLEYTQAKVKKKKQQSTQKTTLVVTDKELRI